VSEKRSRKTRLYNREQRIYLLNKENPRRKGSNRASIFDAIQDGMTVDEFLTAVSEFKGGSKDLQILVNSGHVEVEPLPLQDVTSQEGVSMAS
jgi:ribosomal protein L36